MPSLRSIRAARNGSDAITFPLPGSNYVSALLKPTFLKRDAPLALWFAGLPALSGGVWTLEAVKLRGGDPPAFSCRFLMGRHGHGGGLFTIRREGRDPPAFLHLGPTRWFSDIFQVSNFFLQPVRSHAIIFALCTSSMCLSSVPAPITEH